MKRRRWRSLLEAKFESYAPKTKVVIFRRICSIFRTSVVPMFGLRWHTVCTVCRRGPRGWGQCTGTGPVRFVHRVQLHGNPQHPQHPQHPRHPQHPQHQQHQHSVTMLAQDCHKNEVCVQSWLNVSSSFRPSLNGTMCHQESTSRQQCPTLHQRPPGSTRSLRMSTWRQHQQFHLLHQHLRGTTLRVHQQITPHLLLPWITRTSSLRRLCSRRGIHCTGTSTS